MTLHTIVWALVGALLAYIVWLALRFILISRRRAAAEPPEFQDGPPETIHSQILGGDPERSFSSVFYDGAPVPTQLPDERPEPRLNRALEPDASEFGFDALLEVRQNRVQLDELRAAHEKLQQEFAALKEEMIELRAATQVSPLYSEAVALARRGYDAQAIAERCGISVAEAELVRSLSGDPKEEEAGHA